MVVSDKEGSIACLAFVSYLVYQELRDFHSWIWMISTCGAGKVHTRLHTERLL